MTRRDRCRGRAVLPLESLEGRAVPTPAGMIASLPGAMARGLAYVDLQGGASGTPSTVVGNPEVGTTVDFRGAGVVSGVGAAKVSGALHGTGFIASSRVEGSITLATPRGALTLRLEGAKAGGFAAPGSGDYSFSVARGTGAFARDFGSGTVRLALGPRGFAMTFEGKPNVS